MQNTYRLGTFAETLKPKVLDSKRNGCSAESSANLGSLTSRNTTESG